MKEIPAREIMTAPAICVKGTAPLKDVAQVLDKHLFSGLPVVDDNEKVVGVISEKDLRKYTRWVIGHPMKDPAKLIDDDQEAASVGGQRTFDLIESVRSVTAHVVMSDRAITVSEDDSVWEIIRLINKHNINRVPVVDPEGRLTGIVARADILKVIEEQADKA